MNTVMLEEKYGPVKTDNEYVVIHEGYDFTTIRFHGKPLNVPNMFFSTVKRFKKSKEYFLPTYEEIIEAENIA